MSLCQKRHHFSWSVPHPQSWISTIALLPRDHLKPSTQTPHCSCAKNTPSKVIVIEILPYSSTTDGAVHPKRTTSWLGTTLNSIALVTTYCLLRCKLMEAFPAPCVDDRLVTLAVQHHRACETSILFPSPQTHAETTRPSPVNLTHPWKSCYG